MAAATDLSKITVNGTATASFNADITFTGKLGNGFEFTIADAKTLEIDADIVSGQTIEGKGNVKVTTLKKTRT